MNTRTKVLAALLGVTVVIVGADRYVSSSAGAAGDEAPSARRRYLDQARLVATKREIIEHEAQLQGALDATRATWDELRRGLVTALSAQLAEAQFRDEVLEFVRRRQIEGVTIGRMESKPIGDDERLRLIRLPLSFSTASTREVYELTDGLEHMRDLLTRVASVEITGPGRVPRDPQVAVSIVLESIAYVEGES